MFTIKADGSVMNAVAVVVHPLASVTVTEYPPGQSPVAVPVIWLPAAESHMNVYGCVPPDGLADAVPSQSPLQETSVVVIDVVNTAGSVIVTVAVD